MKRVKRIISIIVLSAFLFNTAAADVLTDKLAAPLQSDDIVGIWRKDVGDLEKWFEACLIFLENKGFEVTTENLKKFNHLPGQTVFQPKGAQFFINEIQPLNDGKISVKIRRKDDKYGTRAYYAVCSLHKDKNDGFPVRVYTEDEYNKKVKN